jgi:F-type H+-transporting ATPase subunit a
MVIEAILASANPLDHVVAHDLFKVGPLWVSNHMLMVGLAGVLMLMIFPLVMRRQAMVPTGVQNFFESICVYLRDEVARPVLRDKTDMYIGLVWTVFFFVLFCNLLGMLPISAIISLLSKGKYSEWGGTATGNIYVTGAMAGFMLLAIHFSGLWFKIQDQRKSKPLISACLFGICLYLKGIVPHIDGAIGKVLFLPLLVLELLSGFVKCVALAIRLFANMIAGHLLLAVILMLIAMSKTLMAGLMIAGVSVFGCVAVSFLELFVAFLQAYIFTFLSVIFIGMAVYQEH